MKSLSYHLLQRWNLVDPRLRLLERCRQPGGNGGDGIAAAVAGGQAPHLKMFG